MPDPCAHGWQEPQLRRLVSVPAVSAVQSPGSASTPQLGFAVITVLVLSAGLVGLLAVNTALAEDAFRVHELRQQNAAADDREQAVQRQVEALRAPHALAARASALGLSPAAGPVFLRLPDGSVVGTVQATTQAPAATGSSADERRAEGTEQAR